MLSILDFLDYCRQEKIHVVKQRHLLGGRWLRTGRLPHLNNLLAHIGLFVITRKVGVMNLQ